jgi:hypothetical protein
MPISPRTKAFDLRARVESILSGVLGALPRGSYLTYRARVGIMSGPVSGVVYALLFAGIPWWFIPGTPRAILEVALWGAVYYGFAAVTARLTSASVLRIIECNILPGLSEIAAKAINDDLAHRYRPFRLNTVASCVARRPLPPRLRLSTT